MSQSLVCTNYSDMKHFGEGFEKINDYEYKCKSCGTVMRITRTPIVYLDDKCRLKVQVVSETKSTIDTFDFDVNGF
jgi:uncharacterized Zn finger protein